MDDAGVGRDDTEVLEGVLTPAQERVALLVPLNSSAAFRSAALQLGVVVDLDRMIDDELDRLQRIHLARVAAETQDAVAHRREIDNGGNAGEVLQQNAGRREGDLLLHLRGHVPAGERLDVLGIDEPRVFAAQQVLEQDLERERQPSHSGEASLLERRQAEHVERLAARGQRRPCAKRIVRAHPLIILHSGRCVQGQHQRRADRNVRATSAGSRRSESTARFIARMSATEIRPLNDAIASRTAGCASRVALRTTGTASYGGK